MDNITYAKEIMNSLLMEAELKDSFGELAEESIIRLVLINNAEEIFVVTKNEAGRIEMIDKKSHIQYGFNQDAIKNGIMTLYLIDSDESNSEGEKEYRQIKKFIVSKNDKFTEIDVDRSKIEDLNKRVAELNSELKTAKKGDILYISTEEINSKGSITNTILLKVIDRQTEVITCVLEGIESQNDAMEDVSSSAMNTLVKIFSQHNIFIKSDNLVKIVKDYLNLVINVGDKGKPINLQKIISIEVHGGADSDIDKEDAKELAKQEFLNTYGHSEEFKQAIEKTPSFWDTFTGASPKGRSQIEKIINRSMTDNSYLTKGNTITFKLLSNTIFIDRHFKLTKNTTSYAGTMEKNNILKLGTRRRGHFELEIIKEVTPSIFNVKIRFCNKELNCESKGKGVIKVIRNG